MWLWWCHGCSATFPCIVCLGVAGGGSSLLLLELLLLLLLLCWMLRYCGASSLLDAFDEADLVLCLRFL